VKTREWNHVDGKLSKIGVELSGEAEASGDTRHGERDQVIEITICRSGQLERAEANIIKGLVVDAVCFIGILDQLVDRQSGVVRLDDRV